MVEDKHKKYYLEKIISIIDKDIKKKQNDYETFEFSHDKKQKEIDSLFEAQKILHRKITNPLSLKCDMSALDKFRENEKKLNDLINKPFDKNILDKEMNEKTNLLPEIENLKWTRLYFVDKLLGMATEEN